MNPSSGSTASSDCWKNSRGVFQGTFPPEDDRPDVQILLIVDNLPDAPLDFELSGFYLRINEEMIRKKKPARV